MYQHTIIVAALALLLAGPVQGQEDGAKLDLIEAIAKGLELQPGTAVSAKVEGGELLYEVQVVDEEGNFHEIDLSAVDGSQDDMEVKRGPRWQRFVERHQAVAGAITLTLAELVARARAQVEGKPYVAAIRFVDGDPVCRVLMVDGGNWYELSLDVKDGALTAKQLVRSAAKDEEGDEGEEETEIRFAETAVFFEYNATDLDLGLHLFFDARGWKRATVRGPEGLLFSLSNSGSLNRIGSTEAFTESAEPPLDAEHLEDSIKAFQARFPAGKYLFTGDAVSGERLVGSAMLTHDLPGAPVLVFPDPAAEENVADPRATVIRWRDGSGEGDPAVVRYQVVVEFEEYVTGHVFECSIDVLADPGAKTRSVTVPPEFLGSLAGLRGEYKAEVLAVEQSGNATISEHEFEVRSK